MPIPLATKAAKFLKPKSKNTKNPKLNPKVYDPVDHIANYVDSLSIHSTVQIALKDIVRDPFVVDTIESHVIMISRIMNHVSLFFKMFIIHCFDNNINFPEINSKFIADIARIICDKKNDPNYVPPVKKQKAKQKPNKPKSLAGYPKGKRSTKKIKDDLSPKNGDEIDCVFSFDFKDDYPPVVRPKPIELLRDFFINHYFHTMQADDFQSLDYTTLTQSLEYEAGNFVTALETHISEHFYDMFHRYCNIQCYLDESLADCKKIKDKHNRKALKNGFLSQARILKKDILGDKFIGENHLVGLKDEIVKTIFGGPEHILTLKEDLQENPLSLLKIMIKMSREGEEVVAARFNDVPVNQRPQFKVINVFPLKTSIIPGFTAIDSHTITTMFFGRDKMFPKFEYDQPVKIKKKGVIKSIPMSMGKDEMIRNGNLLKYNREIWDHVFNMDHKIFKFKHNTHIFKRRIVTDGIGCSLLFIRRDKFKADGKMNAKPISKPFSYREDQYITDVPRDVLDKMKKDIEDGKISLAANDPGYNDIAYFTDGVTKIIERKNGYYRRKTNKLRFTQLQRRHETKSKIYQKRIEASKRNTKIKKSIVKVIESRLSQFNSNSCHYDNFKNYVTTKNEINHTLHNYYCKGMFRYLKWYAKINRRRCDDNLINRFKATFGPPEKVILMYGDQDQHGMKFKEPTKGKSMRRLFKRHGYKVYLVDEFRTSKMLYDQGGINEEGVELEKFCELKNPKLKKNRKRRKKKKVGDHNKIMKDKKLSQDKKLLQNKKLKENKKLKKDVKEEYRYNQLGERVVTKHIEREKVISHELLRSKISTKEQPVKVLDLFNKETKFTEIVINRNLNASLNILYKAKCAIDGKEVPRRFKRKEYGI